ncbi:hypothetical protein ACIBI4_08985 [Streptomyces sp. NPDC050418]|uniref:hypothetical protein n=1 Tax=Streptomyces sp. NPDC050418 TaxID=3365612 RepID=UPI00379FDE4F
MSEVGEDNEGERAERRRRRRAEDPETRRQRVEAELALLRSRMSVPDVDGHTMAERVLAQLVAEHVGAPAAQPPGRRERLTGWLRRFTTWLRLRRARLAAGVCGLLVAAALTPPVRAAVADWFDFGGVRVRPAPTAPPPAAPAVPGCEQGLSLQQAERRAGFKPLLPKELTALSAPPAASVTDDGRVLSLCWTDAKGKVIRLDQFDATLDPMFTKEVGQEYEWVEVDGGTGLWFDRPHRLTLRLTNPEGKPYSPQVRTAGPTLVWQERTGSRTLRLEGVGMRERAVEIAESVPGPQR